MSVPVYMPTYYGSAARSEAVQKSDTEIFVISQRKRQNGSWRWQAVDRQHHRPQCIGSISHWDMWHSQWVNLSSRIANWSRFRHIRWGRTGICCWKKSVHTSSVAHSISKTQTGTAAPPQWMDAMVERTETLSHISCSWSTVQTKMGWELRPRETNSCYYTGKVWSCGNLNAMSKLPAPATSSDTDASQSVDLLLMMYSYNL